MSPTPERTAGHSSACSAALTWQPHAVDGLGCRPAMHTDRVQRYVCAQLTCGQSQVLLQLSHLLREALRIKQAKSCIARGCRGCGRTADAVSWVETGRTAKADMIETGATGERSGLTGLTERGTGFMTGIMRSSGTDIVTETVKETETGMVVRGRETGAAAEGTGAGREAGTD